MDAYSEVDKTNSDTHLITSSPFSRTEFISFGTPLTAAHSTRTFTSTSIPASGHTTNRGASKPFTQYNGRTYLNDTTLPYPLPVDLAELHRQSLRTLLLLEVNGAPVVSPTLIANPPKRVLEIGCGSGFWSMMCHQYFKSRGHSDIEFVGMDIASFASVNTNTPPDSIKPDRDMMWNFVCHDIRNSPWPFADGEFDLVLSKDMTLAISLSNHPHYMEENLRVLKSGGIIEIWETDHTVRRLQPHVPSALISGSQGEKQEAASDLGVYNINFNTPLSAPLNPFLVEYNNWLARALEYRELMPCPCTIIDHYLLQEVNSVTGMRSHRVAIPLSELRWEREGVGEVVIKHERPDVETTGDPTPKQMMERTSLTPAQAALRRTALLTLVGEIQAMEPMIRKASRKSQYEWNLWSGRMMTDLMNENGTRWGECLEIGMWWARKK